VWVRSTTTILDLTHNKAVYYACCKLLGVSLSILPSARLGGQHGSDLTTLGCTSRLKNATPRWQCNGRRFSDSHHAHGGRASNERHWRRCFCFSLDQQ